MRKRLKPVRISAIRLLKPPMPMSIILYQCQYSSLPGTPVVLAIAGPTAAGKTEIVERLHTAFRESGKMTTCIEMDNFLTDREGREAKGISTQGKEALHLNLLQESLEHIRLGKSIATPRYDFVYATSSHDLSGRLKTDAVPIIVEPADIIFIEGNFPFLLEEVSPLD
jgi:uridine kinase